MEQLQNIWEPEMVLNIPDPKQISEIYLVDICGKVDYRTREHLKTRSNAENVFIECDPLPGPPVVQFKDPRTQISLHPV